MKTSYKKLIIFSSVVLCGFLIAILYLSWPLLTGKTYVLATQPVDPFDLIRGQYITISYEISRVASPVDANVGDDIYVVLQKNTSGIWREKATSLKKPINLDFIRGTITSISDDRARVEYGIEQYFFERGATFQVRNMTVEVKVDNSGQARISNLLQDNKIINPDYRK